MKEQIIIERQRLNTRIRGFFTDRGYLEVETPMLSPFILPESTIRHFDTTFTSPFFKPSSAQHEKPDPGGINAPEDTAKEGAQKMALVPSPEIFMKRLLAEGFEKIFQIGRCFRNGEQIGAFHNPEFTMLEWYTVGTDYLEALDLTEQLFRYLSAFYPPLAPPFERVTLSRAFKQHTGIVLEECQTARTLLKAAKNLGLLTDWGKPGNGTPAGSNGSYRNHKGNGGNVKDSDFNNIPADYSDYSWEELFNVLFLTHVEPNLNSCRPAALINYPEQIACPARRIPGTPWRERWELYVQGIEIANCFTEETDPEALEQLIRQEIAAMTERGIEPPPPDYGFPHILGGSFPTTSGAALGVDRLLMAALGKESLEGVILFPFSAIFHPDIFNRKP